MTSADYLLDASALLAYFFDEPGAARVEQVLSVTAITAVNLSEVVAKLYDAGLDHDIIECNLADANVLVLPFDRPAAMATGRLRQTTRHLGLSLGDRACLATAMLTGRIALTADRDWRALADIVAIEPIR